MRISDYIEEETVVPAIGATDPVGALRALVDVMVARGAARSGAGLLQALLRREEIMTTALGGGVAIPHAWDADVTRVSVAVGRSPEGMAWNALDGRPVHLIFLLATPAEDPYLHLEILAGVARIARMEDLKDRLRGLATAAAIADAIAEAEGIGS